MGYSIKFNQVSKTYKRMKYQSGFVGFLNNFFKRDYDDISALKEIDLDIASGQAIGLVGSNGSGKTTFMKLLCGITRASKGRVLLNNKAPDIHSNTFKKSIAVVFGKKSQLWWDLSPKETFLLIKDMYEVSDEHFEGRVKELCDLLNVGHVINSPVRNLSLGERAKCELISSLIYDPSLLLLDEPTLGLDFESQKQIQKFLKSYVKNSGCTLVLVSHYFEDLQNICDRVIVLNKGKKVLDKKMTELLEKASIFYYVDFLFESTPKKEDLFQPLHLVSLKENRCRIKVDKEEISQITSRFCALYSVKDFSIEAPPIMQVIDSLVEADN